MEDNAFKLIGNAGKRVLGATNICLHRAGVPSPGNYRDMLIISFSPAKTKFNLDNWSDSINLNSFEITN